MKTLFNPRRLPEWSCTAFSLIEMLVVIAIISLLMVFAVPSVISTLQGMQISQGTETLVGQLSLAHQFSTTRNRTVELRFYSLPGSSSGNSQPCFRATQLFEMEDSGSATPLTKIVRLPDGIILDSSPRLSSMLGSSTVKQWTSNDTQISLPGAGKAYSANAVDFDPDGTINLSAQTGTPWYVTVHSETAGTNLNTFPKNFALIEIEPWTGHSYLFRP